MACFPHIARRNPFLPTTTVTDEIRAEALVKTREVMGRLELMRKELGLEPQQLDLVATAYQGIAQALADDKLNAEEAARNARRREKLKALRASGAIPLHMHPAAPYPLGFDDDFDDDVVGQRHQHNIVG